MLNFFGLRKDSKKSSSSSEKETDGFVLVGETPEEQKQRLQSRGTVQPSTNVIVLPAKFPAPASPVRAPESIQSSPAPPVSKPAAEPQTADGHAALLGDVPFTLAPHILTMQGVLPLLSEFSMPRDIDEKLANFCYDFTLENSVLHEP